MKLTWYLNKRPSLWPFLGNWLAMLCVFYERICIWIEIFPNLGFIMILTDFSHLKLNHKTINRRSIQIIVGLWIWMPMFFTGIFISHKKPSKPLLVLRATDLIYILPTSARLSRVQPLIDNMATWTENFYRIKIHIYVLLKHGNQIGMTNSSGHEHCGFCRFCKTTLARCCFAALVSIAWLYELAIVASSFSKSNLADLLLLVKQQKAKTTTHFAQFSVNFK